MSGATAASSRVWRRLGVLARDALLRGLPPVELRAILADVARVRAGALTDAELMKRWREDRFTSPADTDPRRVLALETSLWQALPSEFAAVQLSPLTVLGSVSHLTGVSQNRVITSMRGTEAVLDPVHPLAFEASRLRRSGHSRVHLAGGVRALHAWDNAPQPQHQTRFGLVSSAPDGGAFLTEADLADLHLDYWREVVGTLVPGGRVELFVPEAAIADRLADRGSADGIIVVRVASAAAYSNPYTGVSFRIVGPDDAELGDGGLVPWTQTLTRNRKDRCLVSGINVDALVAALDAHDALGVLAPHDAHDMRE